MAAANSRTPAARRRAPGASTRSRSSAKNGNSASASSGAPAGTDGPLVVEDEIEESTAKGTSEVVNEAGTAAAGNPVGVPGPAPLEIVGEPSHEGPAESIADLPIGSSIHRSATEIQIHTSIAGGGRKVFHGRTEQEAFDNLNAFNEGTNQFLPGAFGDETDEAVASREADQAQFDKDAAARSKKDLERRGIKADSDEPKGKKSKSEKAKK